MSCLENNGYETPELNDKLYLHFRGFRKIENLDKYTGCKSLWLESNGFYKIENLERLTELRCLYLAKNLLTKIEGLDSLVHLTILDVSNNRLTSIENISCCPNLQTLNVSHNAIATPEAVVEIKNCPNLNNIDFTSNRLEMTDAFLEIFAEVPSLRSLSLNGNELTKMQTFRKKMIVSVPQLSYLDRPIDEQERFFANAFAKGGQEGEMAARTEWKEMQTKKRVDEMEQFRKWQQEQKELRDAAREANKTVSPMFTPEEIEARQQEADAAHEEERRLLELGISNLATKYWEVDTKHGKSIDALAEAAKQILENSEKQKENMSETSSTLDGTEISMDNNAGSAFGDFTERVAEDLTEDTFEKEDMLRQASLVKKLTTKSITTAEREEDVLHEVTTTEEITVEISDTEDQVALMNKKKEEEEQLIREQRVQESLAIYKQQLKDLEEGKVRGSHSATSTWNDAVQSENVPENKQADAPLFWSEEMDFELARLVKGT